MAAVLAPEGLFLPDLGERLTPERFARLVAQDAAFRLTVDYRGLPPPLDELDVVHLAPAVTADVPATAIVLVPDAGGFRFLRRGALGHAVTRVAFATAFERRGRRRRLGTPGDRWLGALTLRLPVVERLWARAIAAGVVARKLAHPLPCPVDLGDVDHLVAGVRAKYGAAAEVRWQAGSAGSGLEDWEVETFARWLQPGRRVLVLGCGAGREAVALATLGYRVTGVDLVPDLVHEARRFARARGVGAQFVAASVPGLPVARSSFGSAIVSYGVFEHIPRRSRRVRALAELREVVAPGGVVVLGIGWMPSRGPRQALVDAIRSALRTVADGRFASEPGDRLVRHLTLASDGGAPCFYHAFRHPDEIAAEIAEAGWAAARLPDGPWLLRA